LLRRFIHGTFEGHPEYDDLSRSNRAIHRRKARSTTSTLGADYYVKKVNNPLFQGHSTKNSRQIDSESCDDRMHSTPLDMNTESHVLVQLWDTAGKERLKPQRYPAQYDKRSNFYQFLSIRPSAFINNNNNYEHRYNNWGFLNGITHQEDCNDYHANSNNHNGKNGIHNTSAAHEQKGKMRKRHNTNKRHGRPLHYHHHNVKYSSQNNTNTPMGDALFRNIDACMLVYDATSSMSFLHLMQWHSEWVRKLNNWEREEIGKDHHNQPNNERNGKHRASRRRRKRMSFIVVANKLDLLEKEREKSLEVQSSFGGTRRSVMGFREGKYKGRQFKYEYAAENSNNNVSLCECLPHDNTDSTSATTSTTQSDSDNSGNTNKRLTYSLKETLWSTDATYLNALQLTEDQLPANRLMILLWCQRNGIPHVEASALDGRGVDEAMEHLIKIGVEELGIREMETLEERRDDDQESIRRRAEEDAEEGSCWGIRHDEKRVLEEKEIRVSSPSNPCASVSLGNGSSTQHWNMKHDIDDSGNDSNSNNNNSNNISVAPTAVPDMDPSQYYFLYQPRQDDKLDLFARYSPKDEQRCSLFKCWLSLFSNCRR